VFIWLFVVVFFSRGDRIDLVGLERKDRARSNGNEKFLYLFCLYIKIENIEILIFFSALPKVLFSYNFTVS